MQRIGRKKAATRRQREERFEVGKLMHYKRKRRDAFKVRNLVSYYYQSSKISEQYRKIYMNIKFSSVDHKNQTMIITSPGYREGKTTTAVNLGASIAQLGEKVLIIDADLRKPTLHATFKTENEAGLTNVLIGKHTLSEAVNHTGIETLDLLTSGPMPVNPAKLLGSEAMKKLMRTAAGSYDIVLFDTPPSLEVTDANILANECDGVILVTEKGKTKIEKIIDAKRLLELSRATMLGSILNEKRKLKV
jgi:capsular exopolysaccharide synthesis family protein